jgi:hypothetical protein
MSRAMIVWRICSARRWRQWAVGMLWDYIARRSLPPSHASRVRPAANKPHHEPQDIFQRIH